jgi:hypothetical protein
MGGCKQRGRRLMMRPCEWMDPHLIFGHSTQLHARRTDPVHPDLADEQRTLIHPSPSAALTCEGPGHHRAKVLKSDALIVLVLANLFASASELQLARLADGLSQSLAHPFGP